MTTPLVLCFSTVREEEQKRQRIEEEEIWTKALSGELSGPRRAAENVTESQQLTERAWELLAEDRDADLYTAMFKSEPCCVVAGAGSRAMPCLQCVLRVC